ncbi:MULTISPECIES: hypothetical protein [unclassified Moorena]|uniref:hypothetical protein n=1 Tax=unclassified Moorena TaxID=2683338 RepID=UPI0013BC2977|nr:MULTISPECIES: hypothetical protein [unclassified Moorena]NEP34227.1 hypothetical protein [Moorena sp. SIO3B2]NEQ09716.1 hypothetical protein [Moorena sp. SIO4E2]NEQ12639.1 hypothetical protein [Moorena sp. SIO3E2]NER88888.1 hypothetical protein [Moorena sp. SIO3A2]
MANLIRQRKAHRRGEIELKSPRIGGFRGLAAKASEVNSYENGCKTHDRKNLAVLKPRWLNCNDRFQ